MTNPLITIVVPIYKVEKYLGRCIDSLIAQTYPNIEIILADDGSPDRCGAICDEYAQKDSRIKVIHQENKGVAAARNAALDIAQGEYIMFVDSDDYVEPTFCEIPLKTAQQQNADMVIFGYRRFINGKFANIKVAGFTKAMTSAETIRHFVLYDVPSISPLRMAILYPHRFRMVIRRSTPSVMGRFSAISCMTLLHLQFPVLPFL